MSAWTSPRRSPTSPSPVRSTQEGAPQRRTATGLPRWIRLRFSARRGDPAAERYIRALLSASRRCRFPPRAPHSEGNRASHLSGVVREPLRALHDARRLHHHRPCGVTTALGGPALRLPSHRRPWMELLVAIPGVMAGRRHPGTPAFIDAWEMSFGEVRFGVSTDVSTAWTLPGVGT